MAAVYKKQSNTDVNYFTKEDKGATIVIELRHDFSKVYVGSVSGTMQASTEAEYNTVVDEVETQARVGTRPPHSPS